MTGPLASQQPIDQRVVTRTIPTPPRFSEQPFAVITTLLQDGDHCGVVAPRGGLDAMQHRVLDKEMVGQPLHRCRAEAPASVPTCNPKVEKWASILDIVEVEQPDKSDDSTGVANQERTCCGVRNADRLCLFDRQPRYTVKRPITAREERHDRAGLSRTDTLERQLHWQSLTPRQTALTLPRSSDPESFFAAWGLVAVLHCCHHGVRGT